MTAEPNVT
uniref:Uncharacterized protein n=1 Tax=Anguilla anguilla TaxID=7936 RepID=A0A0E9V2B9_ANGAN